MSRAEIGTAARAFVAFALSPPGWIPAWVSLGCVLATGLALQQAALHSAIEVARLQLAYTVYDRLSSTYVQTLSIWLGYKGIGGIVEAFSAVVAFRMTQKESRKEPQDEGATV